MPTASASLYRRQRPRTFADVVGQDHAKEPQRSVRGHARAPAGARAAGVRQQPRERAEADRQLVAR